MSNILGPLEFVGGIAVGTGVGTGVAAAVAPEVQDIANASWSAHPTLPPDAATLALAVAQGQVPTGQAQDWAAQQGISGTAFNALVAAANTGPALGLLYEAWRRGLISQAQFQTGLQRQAIEGQWWGALEGLRDVLLSPADLANARQQNFMTPAAAAAEAQLQGVSGARFDVLFELAGLPPGVETAMEMLRRGVIDQATFAQMVAEGHTKTKYTQQLLALETHLLPLAAAVNGVLKERIPAATGQAVAAQWGYDAATFAHLVDFAGRPPAIGQALTLVNRGVFTEADFTEVVARSDVKTQYAPDLFELRRHYPTLFQMRQMVTSGGLDDATALDWLHKQGYIEPVGSKILAVWHEGKTKTTRDLTVAQIETLYEAGFMDEGQATTLVTALGYDAQETAAILSLARARRVLQFLRAAISRVHSQYVGHRITRNQALTALNNIVPAPDASGMYIALWDEERAANVRPLTQAQVVRARNVGVIDDPTALARLIDMGYTQVDATILLAR